MTKCPECGKEFDIETNYCPYCDAKVRDIERKGYSKGSEEEETRWKGPLKKGWVRFWLAVLIIAVVLLIIINYL